MKIKGIIILLFSVVASAQAQYFTHTINANIRTLRVRTLQETLEPTGMVERPYLVLPENRILDGSKEDNTLEISFDELSHDVHQYSYRVVHCNMDWRESDLSSYEYIKGFTTADVVDYEHSINTQQAYTHYRLEFPNADMQLKTSGNYVLQIYEDGDQTNVVAQVCFCVVEPTVGIIANVRGNTDKEFNGRYQQVDIDVHTHDIDIRNPQDIKLVVRQNNRWDNQAIMTKPTFVEPSRLRYINQTALIFEGGNEFRHFDSYSVYYAGNHVDVMRYAQGEYHALLDIDELRGTMGKGAGREGTPYLTEPDANGQWLINCEKTDYPDTEAEYVWVHFMLPVQQPIMDGHVFVGGDLFNNQYAAGNRMDYNAEEKCYYLYAYLKQGGYDYMYYVLRADGVTTLPIEGSHWQTRNEYTIYVYYRPFGGRYDQLVGYQVLY